MSEKVMGIISLPSVNDGFNQERLQKLREDENFYKKNRLFYREKGFMPLNTSNMKTNSDMETLTNFFDPKSVNLPKPKGGLK